MKSRVLLVFAALLAVFTAQGAEKKKLTLYATLLSKAPVELSDGSKWMMDEGDTFPILMFKEQQTKVVLQLAGANFWMPADQVKILQGKEVTDTQLATYRHNVESYMEASSEKWKERATKPGQTLFPEIVK